MDLLARLKEGKVLVSDGAWGTEFAKKGLTAGSDCPELYNVDSPDAVLGIASSYVEAGSDMILANTFGGNTFTLTKYGVDERLEELNEAGVRLSKQVAGDSVGVLGSIGPCGEFLVPLGLISEEDMTEAFARQIRAFVKGGSDVVLVETMTDLGEIGCAVRAAKENSDLPIIVSMTYDKGLKGYATMMGVTPPAAVEALTAMGVDVIGSNCGAGMDNIIEIAGLIRPETDKPLWFKPNAGLPELVKGETVYRETPEEFAAKAPLLIAAGANIVGGCCGTTPDHIRALRGVVDGM